MIKAEVSLYPVITEELDELKELSTRFLDEHGLDYHSSSGNTSFNTTIIADSSEVWDTLKELFQENSQQGHDLIMVVTMANLG